MTSIMTSIPKIYSSFLRDLILIPIIHKYLKFVLFLKDFSSCLCINILMRKHENLFGLLSLIRGIKFKMSPYKKRTCFVFIEAIFL